MSRATRYMATWSRPISGAAISPTSRKSTRRKSRLFETPFGSPLRSALTPSSPRTRPFFADFEDLYFYVVQNGGRTTSPTPSTLFRRLLVSLRHLVPPKRERSHPLLPSPVLSLPPLIKPVRRCRQGVQHQNQFCKSRLGTLPPLLRGIHHPNGQGLFLGLRYLQRAGRLHTRRKSRLFETPFGSPLRSVLTPSSTRTRPFTSSRTPSVAHLEVGTLFPDKEELTPGDSVSEASGSGSFSVEKYMASYSVKAFRRDPFHLLPDRPDHRRVDGWRSSLHTQVDSSSTPDPATRRGRWPRRLPWHPMQPIR
jgi:hypothetical protein